MRTLCRIEDIDPELGREISVSDGEGQLFLALFRAGNDVHAYLNSCPHQGRSLSWAPGQFLFGEDGRLVCPHHGACFDISTGECISGPCEGASLRPVEVTIGDGEVRLVS